MEKDGDGETGDEGSEQDRAGFASRNGNGTTSTANVSESEDA